jgi:hypothetical protein
LSRRSCALRHGRERGCGGQCRSGPSQSNGQPVCRGSQLPTQPTSMSRSDRPTALNSRIGGRSWRVFSLVTGCNFRVMWCSNPVGAQSVESVSSVVVQRVSEKKRGWIEICRAARWTGATPKTALPCSGRAIPAWRRVCWRGHTPPRHGDHPGVVTRVDCRDDRSTDHTGPPA